MKVGIIGLGSIAQKHIAAVSYLYPNALFYALRHSDSSISKENVVDLFSYEELLDKNLDFIIISNPTVYHYCTLEKLASFSIPLFIEKPLFDKSIHPPLVKSYTYVACNLRFLDCLCFIKNNIALDRINEVNVYCGSFLPEWRLNVDWRKTYSANKELGGGVHIDLIHEIDYLYWILGTPLKVLKIFRNVSSLNISAYDYANYIMEYDRFSASVILNYYRRDYKRTFEIVCDNGTWNVDLLKNSVIYNGVEVFNSKQTILDTYVSQMKYFLNNMNSNNTFNDVNEAFNVLKICLD